MAHISGTETGGVLTSRTFICRKVLGATRKTGQRSHWSLTLSSWTTTSALDWTQPSLWTSILQGRRTQRSSAAGKSVREHSSHNSYVIYYYYYYYGNGINKLIHGQPYWNLFVLIQLFERTNVCVKRTLPGTHSLPLTESRNTLCTKDLPLLLKLDNRCGYFYVLEHCLFRERQ